MIAPPNWAVSSIIIKAYKALYVPHVLVADDAFALRSNLMKPYSARELTMMQRLHNYRLSRARRVIENTFGIMASKFRVLRHPILLDNEKTKKIVLAFCVLHNFLLVTSKQKYAAPRNLDQYNGEGDIINEADWRAEPINNLLPLDNAIGNWTDEAKAIREEFKEYFVEVRSDEGEIPWQYKHL